MEIYGQYYFAMESIMDTFVQQMKLHNQQSKKEQNKKLFEHLAYRIKTEKSMLEKLQKNNLEPTTYNALRSLTDSIGIRIVCLFIDDIYRNVELIRSFSNCTVVQEKDYIQNAKPNGYRSYHMILDITTDAEDPDGMIPGHFFVEVQLRTIAMDTWAALEHEMKYKRTIDNNELIVSELRRCANELAACDVSMQTLRNIVSGETHENTIS